VNIYRLIYWLKKHRIKTVVSLHAEFMYTANCGHAFECQQWKNGCQKCPNVKKANKSWFFDRVAASWKRMKEAFDGFEENCIVAPVSPWTQERAQQSDILKNFRFVTVYNGVDAVHTFCKDDTQPEEKTVLSVTAHFSDDPAHAKGGWYLIQLAERMPDVNFLVAGKTDEVTNKPANLHLMGEIQDQRKLADLYRRVKVSLIVSRRETFSMPCVESLCCGTPVVGFEAGAPEKISLRDYSEFVPFGDLDRLEDVLRHWLMEKQVDRKAIAERACSTYSAQTMVRSFVEIYGRV
jgi:glycosyltransferase involved in cell wall biosynthesis